MQQKFLSLDVRIHHRIWDAQKHLLHTLVKLNKKTFHNQIIKLTMKKTFKSCQTSIKSNSRLQQRVEFATKHPFTRCENSSQNLGCSKTSTSHSCEIEQKDFSQLKNIIDSAANVYIVSTIYKIKVRLQQRLEFATKHPFTRCENSSQNLGYSKTSTSHSCTSE